MCVLALSILVFATTLNGPTTVGPFHSCAWVRAENDGAGAGFVIDVKRKWLITCRHLVADRKAVDVIFPWVRDGELITDRDEYLRNRVRLRERGLLVTGRVLKTTDATDLALLQLDSLPAHVVPVTFAEQISHAGEQLRVVGNRLDLQTVWNLSVGPVRTSGRLANGYFWRGRKLAVNANVVIGQLPTEEGDSGGPVFNARGEVVGMASALRRQCPGAAVCIAAAEIRKFADLPEPKPPTKREVGITDTLTRSTVWVSLTATDVHLAGVLVAPNLVLTCGKRFTPGDCVGVAFPRQTKTGWNSERAAYADPLALHFAGCWRSAIVLAHDTDRQLSLLKLDSPVKFMKPVTLAKKPVQPSDALHAMNHPGGLEFAWVYAGGVVRQRGNVTLAFGEDAKRVGVIVCQLPAQSGSPGGPVLNDRGELVGVLSARESTQHVGYAVNAEEIAAFLQVAPKQEPKRPTGKALVDAVERGLFDRDVLLSLAGKAIEVNEWRKARGDLERILDANPADAEARQQLVRVLLELSKDTEAAMAVRDTLRADPKRLAAVAVDLLSQADALEKKYPTTPSVPAAWLTKAMTAANREEFNTVLKQATIAKDDEQRLATLRMGLSEFMK